MRTGLRHNQIYVVRSARAAGITRAWFQRVIDSASQEAHKNPRSLAVLLVGDSKMQSLNAAYRDRKKTTDVLAFSASDARDERITRGRLIHKHNMRGERGKYLGEIVLCVPQIERQSRARCIPFVEEAARMTIHGFLHLWGYDHIKQKDARKMFPLQERTVRRLCKI